MKCAYVIAASVKLIFELVAGDDSYISKYTYKIVLTVVINYKLDRRCNSKVIMYRIKEKIYLVISYCYLVFFVAVTDDIIPSTSLK